MGCFSNFVLDPVVKNIDREYEAKLKLYCDMDNFYNANPLIRNFMMFLLKISGNERLVKNLRNMRKMNKDELD